MNRSAPQSGPEQAEELQPYELADLLGIDRADAGLLATAVVRLPVGWSHRWKSRRGAMELTATEVAFLLNQDPSTVTRWCQAGRLAYRRAGARLYRIAPAALVACLKKMNGGTAPEVVETAAQRDRRAMASRAEALAMCGQSKPRSKRKSSAALQKKAA